jgi:hypothetical protein
VEKEKQMGFISLKKIVYAPFLLFSTSSRKINGEKKTYASQLMNTTLKFGQNDAKSIKIYSYVLNYKIFKPFSE